MNATNKACDEIRELRLQDERNEIVGQFGLRDGMPITIQGITGRLKSFKAIPASESQSGFREIDITIEIE